VRDREIGKPINSEKCPETADGVARESEAEAGYRFYALYDKISRDDILAHAYAQCRSNKGAPGIDGRDFADIEAYGVERWLAELTLAIREETYRPEPIRRVHISPAGVSRSYRWWVFLDRGEPMKAHELGKGWQYAGYRTTVFSRSEEEYAEENVFHKQLIFNMPDALEAAGATRPTPMPFSTASSTTPID